jgi:hypothetical protein
MTVTKSEWLDHWLKSEDPEAIDLTGNNPPSPGTRRRAAAAGGRSRGLNW